MRALIVTFFGLTLVYGETEIQEKFTQEISSNLHNGLTERIGNFSLELLFHTSKAHEKGLNLITSPITVWTVLAVLSEGAIGHTAAQINNALRISAKHRNATRQGFEDIHKWLQIHTDKVEVAKVNAIFMDVNRLLQKDFQNIAEDIYKAKVYSLEFANSLQSAKTINEAISNATHGRIPQLVDSSTLAEARMILTSALYFKGRWTHPFNASLTEKMPFYNSTGQKIGEVKMMYNRHPYPFANIKSLQARVLELPYGDENRLSMLVMLPDKGVSLQSMFFNFAKVPLDTVFKELKTAADLYDDDAVDCFLPRFKIESNLDLTDVLKKGMGIVDLFDEFAARLPYVARTPIYVSKVIHKAEIEVTEEGTTASGVAADIIADRMGVTTFLANRPFCYLIVEKVTNSIVFGGLYEFPYVY